MTKATKINKEMSFVDVASMTAAEVFNLYRALNYDYPLRCMWQDKLVFLRSLLPIEKAEGIFINNTCRFVKNHM